VKTVPFPTTLRIGYRDFAVEEWDTKQANAAGRYGECDKANAILRIDVTYGPEKAANTLLHEILHACYDISGLTDEDNEERTVTQLSSVMAQVIRDNPHLLAYLGHALA
jgi:cob(I)alamin adenosyltransferase